MSTSVSTQSSTLSPLHKRQFASCLATFGVNGALALSIGTLLPYVRESYALAYAFAGLLVSLHSIGNIISSFFCGVLAMWIGRRRSMILFSLCPVVAYALLANFGSPFLLAFAFLCTGLGRGAVSNFNNAVITEALPGQAWALNTLHASFAVGAFLAPFAVLLCTGTAFGWRLMCYLMMALSLISVVVFITIPLTETTATQKTSARGDLGFLREASFLLGTATLFFYLCTEQGVIGWMVTYFKDSGLMTDGYAQTMASVLWILILAGRLTAAALSSRMSGAKLLSLMSIGFVGFFLVVLFGRTLPVITLGIAGFGFSMAGIYPTTVSLSGDVIKRYPMAWSVMLTVASLGAILMPSIIGAVADAAGIYAGMSCIVASTSLTLCCIFGISRLHRKQAK